MEKHFGFNIKVGFESQHVLRMPYGGFWRDKECGFTAMFITFLGINVAFDWWRHEI